MNRFFLYLCIASVFFLLLSCEKEESGIMDPNYSSPLLTRANLNLQTLNIDLDSVGVTPLGNNTYQISMTAQGVGLAQSTTGPYNGSLNILRPGSNDILAHRTFAVEQSISDNFMFNVPISFTVERSDVGAVRFDFSITPSVGKQSNTLTRTLELTRRNSRPILDSFVAPDTISRPTHGTQLLLFSVVASDSDGYDDISEVFFKRITPTETPIIGMFDDGNLNLDGDAVAGDGIFSRIVSIDSTARLGEQVFLFQAQDKTGALSDSLTHTITIIAE